ncbi:MAG: class I SAM-dependent methyltransferase [Candidatus Dormibacteria bacterium]
MSETAAPRVEVVPATRPAIPSNVAPGPDRGHEADRLHSALSRVLGPSWRLELWDGRVVAHGDADFVFRICAPRGVDSMLSGVPEKAFGRAYVAGLVEVEPLEPFLRAMATAGLSRLVRAWPHIAAALLGLGGRPRLGAASAAEARLRGRRHSRQRDAEAIRHHYDLPPEFYALWLGASMTYSCAYFESADISLDAAQRAKLDLVCRKLRLQSGERLLDIGAGFGSLVMHAAEHYGVTAVGITLSAAQAAYAQEQIRERGLAGRAEVRLADYRDDNGRFDAVASVGMVEHVGRKRLGTYSDAVFGALRPGGRALIHGITRSPSGIWNRASFNDAFVFPDGELEDIGLMVRAYERAGLEVRDVESLREHYALTLGHWSQRLDERWRDAIGLAGQERARVWRLYMRGSAMSFSLGFLNIHQTLAVRPAGDGRSGIPLSRRDWYR